MHIPLKKNVQYDRACVCDNFFFKSFLNLLQYCFCFIFWFFGHEAYGILEPQLGIESERPALEGIVLTHWPTREVPAMTFCWCAPRPLPSRLLLHEREDLCPVRVFIICCCCCSVTKSRLTLCDPMNYIAHQVSLSFSISLGLFKLMSIDSVMPSNHRILCHPLLLLPSIFFPASGSFLVSELFVSVAKVLELQHQSFQLIFKVDFL